MASPIAIDLTRLFVSVLRGRPRGIERVDLDYTLALLADTSRDVFGIIAYPWAPRVLCRRTVAALADAVAHIWRDDETPEKDPSFNRVQNWILNGRRRPLRHYRFAALPLDILSIVARTGLKAGNHISSLPRSCLYLNVGQVGFALDKATGWLDGRRDVRTTAFLHDLLPIHEPEWFGPKSDAYFRKVLKRMLQLSQTIVVSTEVGAAALRAYATQQSLRLPDLYVQAPIPSSALRYDRAPDSELRQTPYFVAAGTIEARKNQLFLLLLWRSQILAGRPMPKLVLAGSRGYGAEEAFDLLDRCDALRNHVLEAPYLTSPALMHLVANSRGLLMPTFAEGFGLPMAEALSLGVPVVASRSPVLEEASRGTAIHLENHDGPAWSRAILDLSTAVETMRRLPEASFQPSRPQDIVELIARIDH